MAQYLSALRPQAFDNTFATPPPIGANTPNAGYFTTVTAQQLRLSVKTITTNYSVGSTDYALLCDSDVSAITITLPNPSGTSGRSLNFKKIDSSEHPIILSVESGTIDGRTTYELKYPMQSIVVLSNGSNYYVI